MGTHASGWKRLLDVDSTDTAFDAVSATATEPAASASLARIDMPSSGFGPDLLQLKFYGTDAADETFSARVWGWSFCDETDLWEPTLIAEFAVTLGAKTRNGVATAMEADTLATTVGGTDYVKIVTSTDLTAYATVDPLGHEIVTVEFDMTGAASGNGLYRRIRRGERG